MELLRRYRVTNVEFISLNETGRDKSLKKKDKFIAILLLILLSFSLFPEISSAHRGGKDELGGHFRRDDCTYFLHTPTPLADSAKNINELISLIEQNNSNSDCVSNLSPDTIELEGFTFPSEQTTPTPTLKPKSTPKTKAVAVPALVVGKKYPATLDKCVDGDTANFIVNGKIQKTRFLYIDTPEYTTETEPYGKEASEFTCNFLKQGKITLETDGTELYDKYDRLLAWVWVGDKLHQRVITKIGLVEDFYDYGDYKYEDEVIQAMDQAKSKYAGMYIVNKPVEETKSEEPIEESNNEVVEVNSTSTENKQEEVKVDETASPVVNNELDIEEEESISDMYVVFSLIITTIFFLLPMIKRSLGVHPLIAHKMRAKRFWINFLLIGFYLVLWWILLIVIIIELIHLFKMRKAY
jgi:micrococcal nuclease